MPEAFKESSRWLNAATAPDSIVTKTAGTPAGVQEFMLRRGPVVSSLTLLNHRLLAVKPPASITEAHRYWLNGIRDISRVRMMPEAS